jgi:hypothetical protein
MDKKEGDITYLSSFNRENLIFHLEKLSRLWDDVRSIRVMV